jgi:hypothetical protein
MKIIEPKPGDHVRFKIKLAHEETYVEIIQAPNSPEIRIRSGEGQICVVPRCANVVNVRVEGFE